MWKKLMQRSDVCSLTVDALQVMSVAVSPCNTVRRAATAPRGLDLGPLPLGPDLHQAQGQQGEEGGEEEQHRDDDHGLLVLPYCWGGGVV